MLLRMVLLSILFDGLNFPGLDVKKAMGNCPWPRCVQTKSVQLDQRRAATKEAAAAAAAQLARITIMIECCCVSWGICSSPGW
jgi:hypothetical protein